VLDVPRILISDKVYGVELWPADHEDVEVIDDIEQSLVLPLGDVSQDFLGGGGSKSSIKLSFKPSCSNLPFA
jgi:hypothetical protein